MNLRGTMLKSSRTTHNTEDWAKYKRLENSVKINLRKAEPSYEVIQIGDGKKEILENVPPKDVTLNEVQRIILETKKTRSPISERLAFFFSQRYYHVIPDVDHEIASQSSPIAQLVVSRKIFLTKWF